MIKEIPPAIRMRQRQLDSIASWDETIFHALINRVNAALMEAAENRCNRIVVPMKTILDNSRRLSEFYAYYSGKEYKLTEFIESGVSLLAISFAFNDAERTWLGEHKFTKDK